jgi:hypothetical protein
VIQGTGSESGEQGEATENGTVQHRSGDRRGHPRFEILGTLTGSLEIWHRLKVQNLGLGGAMVEISEPYAPDARLQGRLTFRGRSTAVRADVRHVTAAIPVGGRRYVVGLGFSNEVDDLDELLGGQLRPNTVDAKTEGDRRRSPRVACADEAEFEFAVWATAELSDVSLSGAMFTLRTSLEPGARVPFRTRFRDRRFDAEVEVRRIVSRNGLNPGYDIGASFVSMDEESRRSLASFLATAES